MGNCSGKMTFKITEKERVEIEKLEGADLSLKLVELVDNLPFMGKQDRVYTVNAVRSYLSK